jgi:hypothetical protein
MALKVERIMHFGPRWWVWLCSLRCKWGGCHPSHAQMHNERMYILCKRCPRLHVVVLTPDNAQPGGV